MIILLVHSWSTLSLQIFNSLISIFLKFLIMITTFGLSAQTDETKDSYLKSTRLRGPSPLSARQQCRPAVGSSRRSACAYCTRQLCLDVLRLLHLAHNGQLWYRRSKRLE